DELILQPVQSFVADDARGRVGHRREVRAEREGVAEQPDERIVRRVGEMEARDATADIWPGRAAGGEDAKAEGLSGVRVPLGLPQQERAGVVARRGVQIDDVVIDPVIGELQTADVLGLVAAELDRRLLADGDLLGARRRRGRRRRRAGDENDREREARAAEDGDHFPAILSRRTLLAAAMADASSAATSGAMPMLLYFVPVTAPTNSCCTTYSCEPSLPSGELLVEPRQPVDLEPTIVARLFSLSPAARTSGADPPRSLRITAIGSW